MSLPLVQSGFSWFISRFESREKEEYWLMRALLFRRLGIVYFCVFFPLLHQYKALLGSKVLLPMASYLERIEGYFAWPA